MLPLLAKGQKFCNDFARPQYWGLTNFFCLEQFWQCGGLVVVSFLFCQICLDQVAVSALFYFNSLYNTTLSCVWYQEFLSAFNWQVDCTWRWFKIKQNKLKKLIWTHFNIFNIRKTVKTLCILRKHRTFEIQTPYCNTSIDREMIPLYFTF